ncbi:hypothetical protein D3C85_1688250 [compost metagenome]
MHRHTKTTLQFFLQNFNVFAFFTDNNTWTGAVNGNAGGLGWTLDNNTAYQSMRQALLQKLAYVDVLLQLAGKVMRICKPFGRPVFSHCETETRRMNLLTHSLPLSCQH